MAEKIDSSLARRSLIPLCDKIGRRQVDVVVHDFYAKVRVHPYLAPFFVGVHDFPTHERHIADFWWIAMGGRVTERHSVDMIRKHYPLNLTPQAFTEWLATFDETVHARLPRELADQWYQMAAAIGANMKRILQI
jgi:hemoglobin